MPQVSATLSSTGPMIDVIIGVSGARQAALKAASQPVPAPVHARLLLDTGASGTCLDTDIATALQIQPTGYQPAHTPSTQGTPQQLPQYDVSLIIPHAMLNRSWQALPVMVANFRAQGIDGLLGRDILSHCLFVLSGPDSLYMLSF